MSVALLPFLLRPLSLSSPLAPFPVLLVGGISCRALSQTHPFCTVSSQLQLSFASLPHLLFNGGIFCLSHCHSPVRVEKHRVAFDTRRFWDFSPLLQSVLSYIPLVLRIPSSSFRFQVPSISNSRCLLAAVALRAYLAVSEDYAAQHGLRCGYLCRGGRS